MKDDATITQEAPVSSQPSFQQLLAAAFIVQEHNDRLQSSNDPDAAYTRTLAEIVETERLIQDKRVDFQTALELIAERTHTITRADGVALGLVENGKLVYRADTSNNSSQLNIPAFITEALAAECFRTGKAMQSPNSREDIRIDQALCRHLGVESLLAVPIRQEGKIAGVLELRFTRPNAFISHDLRTCQLMSGLIGEVLTNKAKQGWKQALASSEEAAVRSVLEHIQPELDRYEESEAEFEREVSSLTTVAPSVDLTPPRPAAPEPAVHAFKSPGTSEYSETLCGRCGHGFIDDEAFCGICGAMRGEDSPVVLNGKGPSWTSLWDIQEEQQPAGNEATAVPSYPPSHDFPGPDVDEMVSRLSDQPEFEEASDQSVYLSRYQGEAERQAPKVAAVAVSEEKAEAEPREPGFLAKLWSEQRATFYMAAAVGLLAVVIVGWAMEPPAPAAAVTTTATQTASAKPELTMFEKMLVSLGLAEAPTTPAYQGDPNAQVWVDTHTALYYCSDADLFGKTKGGKYAKQRDAQLDQFQPAARKACD